MIKPSLQLSSLEIENNSAEIGIEIEDVTFVFYLVFVNDVKTELELFEGEATERTVTLPIRTCRRSE